MILYLVALCAQIIQSCFYLFKGEEGQERGAFQTGGTIGNIVGCGLMLIVGGRALWLFHKTGGLHYTMPEKDDQLKDPLIEDHGEDDDEGDDGDADAEDKTKAKKDKKTAAK